MQIKKAEPAHAEEAARLAHRLWPEAEAQELTDMYSDMAAQEDAAIFLAYEAEKPIGFAQVQLRHDYVEGTDSSPVGYLEGIYVEAAWRHQGCAKQLLAQCEAWAKEKGCTEFASDCELDNLDSLHFHQAMGFAEANRIICFTKLL